MCNHHQDESYRSCHPMTWGMPTVFLRCMSKLSTKMVASAICAEEHIYGKSTRREESVPIGAPISQGNRARCTCVAKVDESVGRRQSSPTKRLSALAERGWHAKGLVNSVFFNLSWGLGRNAFVRAWNLPCMLSHQIYSVSCFEIYSAKFHSVSFSFVEFHKSQRNWHAIKPSDFVHGRSRTHKKRRSSPAYGTAQKERSTKQR